MRLVLASLNAFGLVLLRRSTTKRFGWLTGLFYVLLSCTQSHIPFWMGRTVPNMFAFLPGMKGGPRIGVDDLVFRSKPGLVFAQ